MTEVRIYVEGGGSHAKTSFPLREGFHAFFGTVRKIAESKNIEFVVIACGGRGDAYKMFQNAVAKHKSAFNVLLVDAEGPVSAQHTSKQHLEDADHWKLKDVSEESCHLMVQVIEAWFLADPEALTTYYGSGFDPNAIPAIEYAPWGNTVETIPKVAVESGLANATRNSVLGEYHKIWHASEILALVNVGKVRSAAPHCDRLFTTLVAKMETA